MVATVLSYWIFLSLYDLSLWKTMADFKPKNEIASTGSIVQDFATKEFLDKHFDTLLSK